MANRFDSIGMFWEDVPEEKGQKGPAPERVRPAVPDTGWRLPTSFPRLDAAPIISIDIEGLDPGLQAGLGPGARRGGYICGLAVAVPGRAWYFPYRHEGGGNLAPSSVLRWARQELCRPNQPKVGTNLTYDLDFLAEDGVPVVGPFYDIQNAEALLNENKQGQYSLEAIARHHLKQGKEQNDLYSWCSRAFGGNPTRGHQAQNIWRAPVELVGPYAESDVRLPLEVFEIQRRLLEAEGLWDLFLMESKLVPMLLAMRRHGVRVDRAASLELSDELDMRMQRDHAKIKSAVGREVDIWAPHSLAYAFDKLGLEYPLTEKTKKPSFKKAWLENHHHDFPKLVMELRRWEKFKGTFVDGYVGKHAIDGRIHGSFHQLKTDTNGTVSGRFSSSDPNLQNIPIRDPELGPMIRSLFLPDHGCTWRKDDYSQIEYRGFVHYAYESFKDSADDRIREAVHAVLRQYQTDPNTDYHALCSEWSGLERKSAKNLNFGKIYGMGLATMCAQYGWTMEQAKAFMAAYEEHVPFAGALLDKAAKRANKIGYIKTILGRRCRFHKWEPKEWPPQGERWTPQPRVIAEKMWPGMPLKRAMTYAALNRVLQGSAADIMKKGMVDIWESGVCDYVGPPLLTVHDELDWSVPPTKAAQDALAEARRLMEQAVPMNIPIIVDSEEGPNWGEVK